MLDSNITVRTLANTPANLKAFVAIGESKASNEYHILCNRKRLALVTHYAWEKCDYCNAECGPDGLIRM